MTKVGQFGTAIYQQNSSGTQVTVDQTFARSKRHGISYVTRIFRPGSNSQRCSIGGGQEIFKRAVKGKLCEQQGALHRARQTNDAMDLQVRGTSKFRDAGMRRVDAPP